jgi:hypothetical protein
MDSGLKTIHRAVMPVIHSVTKKQTIRNIHRCIDAGADSVWLINMTYNAEPIHGFYGKLRKIFPDLWIGINPLSIYPFTILEALGPDSDSLSGIWVDNAEINEFETLENQVEAKFNQNKLKELGFRGQYYGGVAFKYQAPVYDLETVTKLSISFMDFITTSGSGTGEPPEIQKIIDMHEYIGGAKPLAIASGITPDNVFDYLPYVERFLVATGISNSFEELDPVKMRNLIEIVKKYGETYATN